MLRRLGSLLLLAAAAAAAVAHGAIFPEQIGDFTRGASKAVAAPDQALYQEFGLQTAEQAEYKSPQRRFTAIGWRLRDTTGALALFDARRPAGATPSNIAKLAVQTTDGVLLAYGNYVIQLIGNVPQQTDLEMFFSRLPEVSRAPLPTLAGFLPTDNLIPNSERYILGPVSLERFEPAIAPSIAAFHLGAEAQLGRYRTPQGDLTLVIFNYPTPSLARDRTGAFSGIPGAITKRTGPLVGVIVKPPDPDAAERVLGQVRYEAKLSLNESVPLNPAKGIANLVLNGFAFAGVLTGLSILVGIGFGGFRFVLRKLGRPEDSGAMITLRLSEK